MFINDKRLRSLRHIVRSWLHDEPTPEASGVLEVARWHRLDGLPGINPDTNAMKIRVAMELGHQALAIEIDRVFRAAGVRYVTTKGVSLARRCGWPIGTRLGKDIDILVHHKDRFLAIDSLLDLGFVSSDGIRGLHEAFNIVYALGFRRKKHG